MATSSATSHDLREAGNAHYKAGRLEQAKNAYEQAAALSPEDPAPLSNLSAVLFELADYGSSIAHADRALALSEDEAKRQRLYTRKVTALIHTRQYQQALETLQHLNEGCKKNGLAKCLETSLKSQRAVRSPKALHAKIIADIPRYKPKIRPILEYYPFGHDFPMSLLDAPLAKASGDGISIMFGGIGDMRHLFATLIRIGELEREGDISKKNYHLTLVDCHPATIARNVVLLLFLDELIELHGSSDKADRARGSEIMHCLYYTYMAPIMPPLEHDILQEKLDEAIEVLQDPDDMPDFLSLAAASRPEVIRVLREWQQSLNEEYPASRIRPHVVWSRHKFDTTWERDHGHTIPSEDRNNNCLLEECVKQDLFYRQTGVLVLHNNDGGLKELGSAYLSFSERDPTSLNKAFLTKIDSLWKTNPTLIDLTYQRDCDPMLELDSLSHNPFDLAVGLVAHRLTPRMPDGLYGDTVMFFLKALTAIRELGGRLQLDLIMDDVVSVLEQTQHDLPRHACHASQEAEPAVESLTLSSTHDVRKPSRIYDRIHLSNIPDYITNLNTFIHALPVLHERAESYVTSNCLKGSSLYKTFAHYNNEHLALSTTKELRQVFQVRMGDFDRDLKPNVVAQYVQWHRDSTGEQTALMNRAQLDTWLYRIFFKIAIPAEHFSVDGSITDPAPNLTAFVRICGHLNKVGYPAHWISGVLDEICSGQVTTTARPPRSIPLQLKELRKETPPLAQSTHPFVAELTTLLSIWQFALPSGSLCMQVPITDIQRYSCQFDEVQDQLLPYRPALVLCIYSGDHPMSKAYYANTMLRNLFLSDERGSTSSQARQNMHMISTWEWNLSTKTAIFCLRKDVIENLRSQQSCAIRMLRTDSWTVQSAPESLDKLKELGPFWSNQQRL